MKKLSLVLGLMLAQSALAQSVALPDYNWSSEDISSKGITKERLFSSMDRDLVKLGNSICANRALLWVYDFKRNYDIDASKIFLFYTGKTGDAGAKTWWYHVSPIIAEKGVEWVMDAGFGASIKAPISVKDWLFKFTGSHNCKEIRSNETELVKLMFGGRTFPEKTQHGSYDCYYKKVPAGYWFPGSVATNILGENADGTLATLERPEINKNEVYAACKEASTGPIGGALGLGSKKCKKYLDM